MSEHNFQEEAEDAFEDSGQYEFKGRPLWFGYRHYYAMTAIGAHANMSAEEQVLLVFWIATHDAEGIKRLRAEWRRDQEEVFSRFEDAPEDFGIAPGSQDMLDLAVIVNKIWQDVESSRDEVKRASKKGGKEDDGQPGK